MLTHYGSEPFIAFCVCVIRVGVHSIEPTFTVLVSSFSLIRQLNGSEAKPKNQGVQTERARERPDNARLTASVLTSQTTLDYISCILVSAVSSLG